MKVIKGIVKSTLPLMLVGMGLFTGQAWAAPIAVANFSFEDPETGAGGGVSPLCPTSWTCTPAAAGDFHVGVYSPSSPAPSGQYNNNGTDGLASGHTVPLDGSSRTNNMNTSGGYEALYFAQGSLASLETVSQDTVAIANNTIYTLDVWAGHPNDKLWGNAHVELLANGVVVADSGLIADPGLGQWADHSLIFNSGASGFAGQTLRIAILDQGNVSFGGTNFDVVTLDGASTVPEPSTVMLLGTGLVALGLYGRRKAA